MNYGLQMLEDGKLAYPARYQRLVGRLSYLLHTWPDISNAL